MSPRILAGILITLAISAQPVWADDDDDRAVRGVLSGLLGVPQQQPDAAYLAKERERLVSLLQSGKYVTSRQGEMVDLSVLGVPLTKVENVYTARPIPPSQSAQ